jgi:hypothetical protein
MVSLTNLHMIEVVDILSDLPSIVPLDTAQDMSGTEEDLFITALGFEDRCLWIPEILSDENKYRTIRAVYFEYGTNQSDNDLNRPRLLTSLESFAAQTPRPMPSNPGDFTTGLHGLLSDICAKGNKPKVTFDISVCSSRLLITALTILFEYDIQLRLLYSEARLYHPTKQEYEENPEKWTIDEEFGLARGVSTVIRSPDHPGSRRDNLPEVVIAFPTFKPERVKAILTDVDPSLCIRPENRVVWVLGEPHLPEDRWRTAIQRDINEISESTPSYEVSTFDYKKTLEILERIYRPFYFKSHVNIVPLGSKFQSLGVLLFWLIRPEVSIYFATPREYNATQYSEGCKNVWHINFGSLPEIKKLLNKVGQLSVVKEEGASGV